jgi:hypothetical protein
LWLLVVVAVDFVGPVVAAQVGLEQEQAYP